MTKIDKNITRSFFKTTLMAIFGFVGISVLTQLNRAVVRINEGTLTFKEGMMFLFSGVPTIFVMLMPIATLLGALMTVNKMASSSELVALKTSGVSFKRIIKYPLILAFFFAIVTAIINDDFATYGNRLKRELKGKYALSFAYSKEATYNVYMRGKDGYILNVGTVYGDYGEIYTVTMINMNKTGDAVNKIFAIESAKYDPYDKIWRGKNVYVKDIVTGKEDYYNMRILPELKEVPKDLVTQTIIIKEASFATIRKNAILVKAAGGDVKSYILEMHKRIATPLSVFIISFFGFALGSRYVRGASAINVAISIILGYSTYVVQSIFEAFVTGGQVSPIVGAWAPNIIFFIIGMYTMHKAEF